MSRNEYLPFISEVMEIIKHTDIEYTFRMKYIGAVKPGQFFEVSLPKYGEAPISVCGVGSDYIDLTIRRVGKVTDEVFEKYQGDTLFLRGPYGNGFDVDHYKNREIVVVAGGTGLSPVKGVVDYFSNHIEERTSMKLIAGFKSPKDVLFRDDFKVWEENMDIILTVDDANGDPTYTTGLVTDFIPTLKISDIDTATAVVVGPPAMMKFTTLALVKFGFKEENIWVSYERKMCCGIGKCGHCKINDSYACIDGPVFRYTKSLELVD